MTLLLRRKLPRPSKPVGRIFAIGCGSAYYFDSGRINFSSVVGALWTEIPNSV